MTNLRPDTYTRIRHGGGRLPPDCLHMQVNKLPTIWLSILLRLINSNSINNVARR